MTSELNTCLTKAISAFNVRKMLTELGVPEDAEVAVDIQLGDDTTPIASCSVPTTVKKDHIPCGSISMMSFKTQVADDFINPALHTLDLDSLLPKDEKISSGEKKLKVCFRSDTPDFNMDLVTILACCWPGCQSCCRFC